MKTTRNPKAPDAVMERRPATLARDRRQQPRRPAGEPAAHRAPQGPKHKCRPAVPPSPQR